MFVLRIEVASHGDGVLTDVTDAGIFKSCGRWHFPSCGSGMFGRVTNLSQYDTFDDTLIDN